MAQLFGTVFFHDVHIPASSTGGHDSEFADDLTVFKAFDRFTKNEDITREMHVCRTRVHKWGHTNRVAFDPSKEHTLIIHPIHGDGDAVKLLGCLIDAKLIMRQCVDALLSRARPKIKAILRTRRHYSVKDLIGQFKTHVWGLLEYQTGAYFHASSYLLKKFDSAQRGFLEELQVDEATAFIAHNFAPPTLRRNIGILGLLHKRVLGKAHPVFKKLLPFLNKSLGNCAQMSITNSCTIILWRFVISLSCSGDPSLA